MAIVLRLWQLQFLVNYDRPLVNYDRQLLGYIGRKNDMASKVKYDRKTFTNFFSGKVPSWGPSPYIGPKWDP